MYADVLIAYITGAVCAAVLFSILYGRANYRGQESLRRRAERAEDDLAQALRREGLHRSDNRQLREAIAKSAVLVAQQRHFHQAGRVTLRRSPEEKKAQHAVQYGAGPLHRTSDAPSPRAARVSPALAADYGLDPAATLAAAALATNHSPPPSSAPVDTPSYSTGGASDSGSSFSTGGSDGASGGFETGGSV